MDCLTNGAITASQDSTTKDDQSRNGASYAAIDLLTNPLIQQNVGLCKTLQAAIKPPSARKIKDIRRDIGVNSSSSPINLAAMSNSRFYRKKLTTIACEPVKSSQVIEIFEDGDDEKKKSCKTTSRGESTDCSST